MKNKNFIIFFIVTVIFVFTLFIVNYITYTKRDYIDISQKMLYQEAISLYNNIVNTRAWASKHNGVYVLANDKVKPNPYLEDNHTYTHDGKLLVKVNPAWMTRQLSEISNKKENYYFKITSLHPINPDNIPDAFEKRALEYLQKHKNQKYYTSIDQDKYNFLGALQVDNSCLKCHHSQGYRVGDNVGGLRVSIPIDTYNENVNMITSKTDLLYLITFFTTIIFICVITFTIHSIYKREKNIMRLNRSLEKKVKQRTKELSTANEQLLKISTMDFLTNIPNRRYFFEAGNKAIHLAVRQSEPLAILCVDIDFFKKVNDTYGHQVGDEILKLVASTMNKQIRKSDILARTGGEEFCMILNNTDKNGAYTLAEKIRKTVENSYFRNENVEVRTTISIGVTHLEKNNEDLDALVAKADEALYIAKKCGRNQTAVYP